MNAWLHCHETFFLCLNVCTVYLCGWDSFEVCWISFGQNYCSFQWFFHFFQSTDIIPGVKRNDPFAVYVPCLHKWYRIPWMVIPNTCYKYTVVTTATTIPLQIYIHIPIKSQEDFQAVQSLQKAIMFWTSSASKPSMSWDSGWNCNQIMKSVQLYTPIASCTLEMHCGVLHQDLHVHNLQACCNPWPQHSSDLCLQYQPILWCMLEFKLWLNYTEVMLHIHISYTISQNPILQTWHCLPCLSWISFWRIFVWIVQVQKFTWNLQLN